MSMHAPSLQLALPAQVLGKGNFGVVHLVYEKKTNKPFACKSISKRKLVTADDIEDVRREVQILLHLAGHKNVVQMYGAYEDKSYIHLVMVSVAAIKAHPGLAWWGWNGSRRPDTMERARNVTRAQRLTLFTHTAFAYPCPFPAPSSALPPLPHLQELCAGGELFDRIAEKGHFSEKQAAEVMRTIVSVVHHCHTMNVIHRDLKPENFLLTSKGADGVLKVCGWGIGRWRWGS